FHDFDESDDTSEGVHALELETDNGDSSHGDSGGPFFRMVEAIEKKQSGTLVAHEGPMIVGVTSGSEIGGVDSNVIAAGGNAMVALVHIGREFASKQSSSPFDSTPWDFSEGPQQGLKMQPTLMTYKLGINDEFWKPGKKQKIDKEFWK